MADRDYEVGFGKPPRHSQFKPGQSGNAKGRPRGAKGFKAELQAELDEWVTIIENGRSKRVRKRRVIAKSLVNKAAKGHVPAVALAMQTEGPEDQRPQRAGLSETDEQILRQFLGDEAGGVAAASGSSSTVADEATTTGEGLSSDQGEGSHDE